MAASYRKRRLSYWIVRSLLLGLAIEVYLLLGGLEMLGLKSGPSSFRKMHQDLKEAGKVVTQTLSILGDNKGGQQAMAELEKILRGESLKDLERIGREDMERNPFAFPRGVHTLKELEEMARRKEEGAEAEGVARADLKITGIFVGKNGSAAIVGGNLVQVGDLIGNEQVSGINSEGVVLERDGNRRTLHPSPLEGWMPPGEPLSLASPNKAKSIKGGSAKRTNAEPGS